MVLRRNDFCADGEYEWTEQGIPGEEVVVLLKGGCVNRLPTVLTLPKK